MYVCDLLVKTRGKMFFRFSNYQFFYNRHRIFAYTVQYMQKASPCILGIRRRPLCVYFVYAEGHHAYSKCKIYAIHFVSYLAYAEGHLGYTKDEYEEVCDFGQRKPPLTQLKTLRGKVQQTDFLS